MIVQKAVIMMSFIGVCLMSMSSKTNNSIKADFIVTNARIWTGNVEQPYAEAMALSKDKIVAVGKTDEISDLLVPGGKKIDAKGKLILPGFIDSHVHFIAGGYRLASVQLRDAKTPEEFIGRITDFAKSVPAGTWITGGDWDHENWGGELPTANWIDSVTPNNPVFVSRLDGHMALANTEALNLAKITSLTKDVEGGEIIRDGSGKPTGILKDNAMNLVYAVQPEDSDEMNQRALAAAMKYVAMQGVTSVHHMGGWGNLQTFKNAQKNGLLKTRIYASVPISSWQKLADYISQNGAGDEWLKVGGLKGFVDGSLGSHTAAFFEPYTDNPSQKGFFVNDYSDLFRWILNGDRNNLQAAIHAIGDSAISELIDIFEKVQNENGIRDRRFRIEHAQHIAPKDFARFEENKIVASMQPYHCIDDGRWAEKIIGPERIKTTYAFRTLLDNNVKLALGSDWFVAPPTPLEGIYAAVTRRTLDDKNPRGWVAEQKISVEEALRAYTIDAAYASFDEEIKGSLEVGKLADFVILDQDIINIEPSKIRDVKVLLTVIGGEIVFEK